MSTAITNGRVEGLQAEVQDFSVAAPEPIFELYCCTVLLGRKAYAALYNRGVYRICPRQGYPITDSHSVHRESERYFGLQLGYA